MIKKYVALLSILLQLAPALAWSALSTQDLAHIPQDNILNNPGFESGKAYWSVTSGDTWTVNQSTVNRGYNTGAWTPSASGHALTSNAMVYAQNAGYAGMNGVAFCFAKTTSSTYFFGINSSGSIISNIAPVPASTGGYMMVGPVNFIFPNASSNSLTMVFSSGSDQSTIYPDSCVVGPAAEYNLSQVSQAQLVGYVTISGCSGSWTTTATTSPTTLSPPSGCTTTAFGNVTSAGSNVLGVTVISGSPGSYKLEYEGLAGNTTAGKIAYLKFNDGTNSAPELSEFLSGSGQVGASSINQHIDETSALSNTTFTIEGYTDSSGTLYIGNGTVPSVIRVYYYPTSAQQALSAQTSPANWTGTTTLSATTTSTTLADINTSLTGTVTKTSSQNITCAAASGQLGITCTLPSTGMYSLCYSGYTYAGAAASWYQEITDSSNVVVVGLQNGYNTYSSGGTFPTGACGNYLASSTTVTFKTRGYTSSGTENPSITSFSVTSLNTPIAAPIIIGSVTSNSAAASRIEAAAISSTCAVTSNSSSWITGATNPSAGVCTFTMSFNGTPWCWTAADTGDNYFTNITVSSSTAMNTRTAYTTTGGAVGAKFQVFCLGSR